MHHVVAFVVPVAALITIVAVAVAVAAAAADDDDDDDVHTTCDMLESTA